MFLVVLIVCVFLALSVVSAQSTPRRSFTERFPVTGSCENLGFTQTNIEVRVFMKDYSDPTVYDYARKAIEQRKTIPDVTAGFVVIRKVPHQKRFVYEFREVIPNFFLPRFWIRQSEITSPDDWDWGVTEERFVREQAEIFSADEMAVLSDWREVFRECVSPLRQKAQQ